MSMHKSSTIVGAPAEKSIDWTKVPDEELVTDIDDMDSVGNVKAWEKCRRLHAARDEEIWRAEEARREAEEREWKCQVEEVEKCQKEEEARHQREAEAEQKQEAEKAKRAAAAGARKWQRADSEAQASGSQASTSACIRCARLKLTCVIPAGVKKRSACGSCTKAKERCKWPEVEMMASRAGMSPRGGECKKWAKKVADKDNNNKQQTVLSKLVEMASGAESGRAKEVVEGQEEPQELQGEGLGGQEETEGVPGGVPGNELENALGNELENGAGAEDGTEEEAQKDKGKGKEKAL
ncbi:hypothetical protein ID866_11957 [Astraeus odoratus]|nr:hypothetical protein ID866_11957 [Astraeus odoratus]